MDKKTRTAISLFSGAGGMDIGFAAAGFKILACVEVDPACCQTLRANVPSHTIVLEADVRRLTGADLLQKVGLNERGQLVGEFIRLVHEIQPKSFVMENVKGMATWGNGAVLDYIEHKLANPENGPSSSIYTVSHKVLNAADFGIP